MSSEALLGSPASPWSLRALCRTRPCRVPPPSLRGLCTARCRQALSAVGHWWSATTDRAYLKTCTRRLVLKILAVVLVLALCIVDQPSHGDAAWFYSDNLLFSIILAVIPYNSPWMDLVVGAWTSADCWGTLHHDRTAGLYRSLISMLWMQIGGMHSLCMLPLLLVILCVGDLFKEVDKGISPTTEMVCCVCMVSSVFLTEWHGASLFRQLHRLVQTKQHLLDQTTDGRFTLSLKSGTISDASTTLEDTLGSGIDGASIFDFVGPGDCAEVARLLSGQGAQPPGPVQGTFLRRPSSAGGPTVQFEAKLVPYAVCEGGVHVCLQKVGEGRSVDAPARRAHGGVAPAEAAGKPSRRPGPGGLPKSPPPSRGSAPELEHESTGLPEHDLELGTEISFHVSQSSETSSDRRRPCVRTVSVQTDPRRPSAQSVRPPLSPGANLLSPPLPKRTKKHRQVRHPPWAQLNLSTRQVPTFNGTPMKTRTDCLIDAMERVNACGKGCCNLHISTAAARQALDSIDLQACREMQFADGGQCPSCFVLMDLPDCHGEACTTCDCCGERVVLVPPGGSSPSSARSLPPVASRRAAGRRGGAEFSISVDRSGGGGLGVDIDIRVDPCCLVVRAVGAGLVQEWNEAHEAAQVRVDDRMVEVNGIRGDEELMIAECRQFKPLEIVFHRLEHAG